MAGAEMTLIHVLEGICKNFGMNEHSFSILLTDRQVIKR